MNKKNLPLWQLSVEEFINLLKENGIGNSNIVIAEPQHQSKNYVYGISGLAKLLNCSKVTAQKIKNSGKIDHCYSQAARKLVFDANMVLEAFKKGGRDENR